MVDLHTFLPPGFTSSRAFGIDSDGNIVGWADGPTSSHAILWQPVAVPEPGTLTLLAIGLAALRAVWRRQR
jgi:hypothetical protein